MRIRWPGRKQRLEELKEEIETHLAMATEDLMERGAMASAAAQAARRELGNFGLLKEVTQDIWGGRWWRDMLEDLRYGARILAKSPGFMAVAVLTLALGIGVNAAVFSVVHAVLLRPLPYPHADRLVMVWEKVHLSFYNNDENNPSPGNFADWKLHNHVFEQMAASRYRSFNLTGDGPPVRVEGEGVSASLFSTLQVKAAIGRVFSPAEDQPGDARVAVIAHDLWVSRYGSDPQILEKSILLDGENCRVIGVMPIQFHFPDPDDQIWVPLALTPGELGNHGSHYLRVMARLKPQVTLAQAQAEMETISRGLTERYPDSNAGQSVNVIPLQKQFVGNVRPALLVLFAAVGMILLIACVNVSNLLLARASVRRREISIRVALGASRLRVARQLLTESALMALSGCVLGLLLAHWGLVALEFIRPQELARAGEIRMNGTVLGFGLGLALFATLLFGLAPAWHAARDDLRDSLKEGVRESAASRRFGARNLLVVSETVLAVMVVTGAGLLLRSFLLLENVPPGFDPQQVLTFRVIPRGERYADLSRRTIFYHEAIERISALPQVKAAGAVTFLPLYSIRGSKGFSVEGRTPPAPGQVPMADYEVVSPGYFGTLRVPLLEGRDFTWSDTPAAEPVILINEVMAQTYWPKENPVGRRIKQGLLDAQTPWMTIVGVIGNIRAFNLATAPQPTLYFPSPQFADGQGLLRDWVVRVEGDPTTVAADVRGAIWSVDKDLPISRVQTMGDVRAASLGRARFNLLLLGVFACLAMTLAAVGVYGVTAYSVAQRTREIGIRAALGAGRRDLLRLVVGEGMARSLAGVAIGLVAALGAARLMASLLFGIAAADPLTFLSVAVLLLFVGLCACYFPARRAAHVDPIIALRYE